ncbi:MAG: TetR/AcrR family transcriptional regulator [Treponema sp.]|nr:TetR/AcrR family transcriptional regulator [Treponema sp.]
MSIVVEHEKRRREILEKALDVFMDEGFEDVTFQKIADRSGITRTTLYIYFKNKKEIFNYSFKQFLQELENDITGIKGVKGLSYKDQLINVMSVIINRLEQNQRLLNVVLNSFSYITKGDNTPDYRMRRRTVRLRHILNSLIIEGIRAKEFVSVNIKEANEALYGFIEAAIFRLAILHHNEVDELKKAVVMVINQMAPC